MAEKPAKSQSPAAVPVQRATPVPAKAERARALWSVPAWEREIDRLFDSMRRGFSWPRMWAPERWPALDIEVSVPAVDVFEKGDDVMVKAEIPGMSKDDIEVTVTDSTLTVKGQKKKEEEVKEENYYRSERSFGSFLRTVELPAEVKTDQAKATFKDGILEVLLPKTEQAKRKTVSVKVS